MKFVCQHCGSKYTIADERVRGKILKIRCKNCSQIIEVRDPERTPSRPPISTDQGTEQAHSVLSEKFAESFRSPDGGQERGIPGLMAAVKHAAEVIKQTETERVVWFAAINNSPTGPLSANKVHDHRKAGRVTDLSLVWKEGMPDWAPLRDCKELIGLLALVEIEEQEKTQKDDGDDDLRLGLFKEQETDSASPLKGLGIGVIGEHVDASAENKSALSTKKEGDENGPLAMDIEGGVGALRVLAPPRSTGQLQNRMIMLAAIGLFIVAIFTLIVALLPGGGEGQSKTAVKTVERVIEKVVYLDKPTEEAPAVNLKERPNYQNANARKDIKESKANRAKSKSTDDKKATDEKTRELLARLGIATPTGVAALDSVDRKSNGSNGLNATALTANQVKIVVDKNKASLRSCYERALRQGEAPDDRDIRVDFQLAVGSTGMVKNVLVKGEGTQNASMTTCLKRSISKWIFPPSAEGSPVEFPFIFTPH